MNVSCENKISKSEFGDFQTPIILARKVCSWLTSQGLKPRSILEPTCGHGSFLLAALEVFPFAEYAYGVEINGKYVKSARESLGRVHTEREISIIHKSFFDFNWKELLDRLPDPILIIGNPPWVTNSDLMTLGSSNLPPKSNAQNLRGIEAITGKSNFDISEWMLNQNLKWIDGRNAMLAMLCKTSVARKVLRNAWRGNAQVDKSSIFGIDANEYFGASVDACLLVITAKPGVRNKKCTVYASLDAESADTVIGFDNGTLIANISTLEQYYRLLSNSSGYYNWRSGVKHDCAKVMELKKNGDLLKNGFDKAIQLESEYVFPLLKSSDLANGNIIGSSRRIIIPQRRVGEDTSFLQDSAPGIWEYLTQYSEMFDNRGSSIYRDKPRFSIFGIGDYSFAPWKVAISGFYKRLDFRVVGPIEDKPVMFDDTCYFIACHSEEEATLLADMLNSRIAHEFLSSFIFWDQKRPITLALLSRLNLEALAEELGQLDKFLSMAAMPRRESAQMPLFAG